MTIHRPHLQRARKRGKVVDLSALPTALCPITEAAANDNHYVAEFTSGNGASETGVGLGMTGSDLVLPLMGGNCYASSGGWRNIPQSGGYFSPSLNFLKRWATGEDLEGFSYLQQCRNLLPHVAGANTYKYSMWFTFQIQNLLDDGQSLYSYSYLRDEKRDSVGNGEERYFMDGPYLTYNKVGLAAHPMFSMSSFVSQMQSNTFWKAWSLDFKRGLWGYGIKIGAEQPKGFLDCDVYSLMSTGRIIPDGMTGYSGQPVDSSVSPCAEGDMLFKNSDNTWERAFVGGGMYVPNANYMPHGLDIKSVTFSRKPFGEV